MAPRIKPKIAACQRGHPFTEENTQFRNRKDGGVSYGAAKPNVGGHITVENDSVPLTSHRLGEQILEFDVEVRACVLEELEDDLGEDAHALGGQSRGSQGRVGLGEGIALIPPGDGRRRQPLRDDLAREVIGTVVRRPSAWLFDLAMSRMPADSGSEKLFPSWLGQPRPRQWGQINPDGDDGRDQGNLHLIILRGPMDSSERNPPVVAEYVLLGSYCVITRSRQVGGTEPMERFDHMQLTASQKKKVEAWIGQKKSTPCPSCGSNKVSLSDVLVQLSDYSPDGLIPGGHNQAMLIVGCDNCGHVSLYSALQIGIV